MKDTRMKYATKLKLKRVAKFALVFFLVGALVTRHKRKNLDIFIAIGTSPENFHLREGLRKSWLQWVKHNKYSEYLFFTENQGNATVVDALKNETRAENDIFIQPLTGGYQNFALRGLYQMEYALKKHPRLKYFLRVDDDSFLCYQKFFWELKKRPKKNFFWGKYWCQRGRHRADENFMLFSTDVARKIIDGVKSGKLKLDPKRTFAWNFGVWSEYWYELIKFDDRERFDTQQGLLTVYMHERFPYLTPKLYKPFCERFIYAHWVKSPVTMQLVYNNTGFKPPKDVPRLTTNIEGCPDPAFRSTEELREKMNTN